MHIGLVGPIATADIKHLLDGEITHLPKGYAGGPLLATLIGELLSRGHTVSAYTLSNDLPLQADHSVTATGNRFTLHYIPMRPRAWRPNGWRLGRIVDLYRFEIKELQKAIQRAQPDVLHAHWVYEFALAATATPIPCVITCHDSPYTIAKLNTASRPTRSLYRWLRVIMALRTFKRAEFITAVSPYMRDAVQNLARHPITVVPNPIDVSAIELGRARSQPPSPQIAMVCNGWDTRKNPQPGLVAFRNLQQQNPTVQMHLYGADFGPGQIAEQWCNAQGIKQGLHFHGALPHHQLLQELNKHDLLLHTSIEESFGMVIAEAMAMGLPVVAGESSGAVPWVVGINGCLCDVRNASSIEKALLATLDSRRYNQLSQDGIEAVRQRFTTPAVVDLFFAQYELAIAQAASKNLVKGKRRVTL